MNESTLSHNVTKDSRKTCARKIAAYLGLQTVEVAVASSVVGRVGQKCTVGR